MRCPLNRFHPSAPSPLQEENPLVLAGAFRYYPMAPEQPGLGLMPLPVPPATLWTPVNYPLVHL